MGIPRDTLFQGQRVGVYLDKHEPRLKKHKRSGDEIHMLDLRLRVQPLTPELAGTFEGMRPVLFRLSTAEPVPNLALVGFKLDVPRQLFECYAAPDATEPTLVLDHVELGQWKARTEKGVEGWALTFRATIGPVSSQELEYIHAWYTQERWVRCILDAQPSLFDDLDDAPEPETDDDEPVPMRLPEPMWQDGDERRPEATKEGPEPARILPQRHPRTATPVVAEG